MNVEYKKPSNHMKFLGYFCLAISAWCFISGFLFSYRFDIDGYSISVTEVGILQVIGIRYLTGAVFALISTILFIGRSLLFKA